MPCKFSPGDRVQLKPSKSVDTWTEMDKLQDREIYIVENFLFDKLLKTYYISLVDTEYFHLQDKFIKVSMLRQAQHTNNLTM